MAFEPPTAQGMPRSASMPTFWQVLCQVPWGDGPSPAWLEPRRATGRAEESRDTRRAWGSLFPAAQGQLPPRPSTAVVPAGTGGHGHPGTAQGWNACPLTSSTWALWNICLCDKGHFLGEPTSHSQVSHLHSPEWLVGTNGKYFSPDVFSKHMPGTGIKDWACYFIFFLACRGCKISGQWLRTRGEYHFLVDAECWAQGIHGDSPSPAHATYPDLMFQSKGKGAYFFLSVNFKEINIEWSDLQPPWKSLSLKPNMWNLAVALFYL